jgi:hypothetical protein
MTAIATVEVRDGVVGSFGIKAPDDLLDYGLRFPGLPDGDALSGTPAITAAPFGLTIVSAAIEGAALVLWIEGGSPDTAYMIGWSIGTAQGRALQGEAVLYVGAAGLDDPSIVASEG